MRSEGRGCRPGHFLFCKRRKKKEDRPVPKPVRNYSSFVGRGCGRQIP